MTFRALLTSALSLLLIANCLADTATTASNTLLLKLFQQDQKDRNSGIFLMHRDAERRKLVNQLIKDKQLNTAEDYYHAAMIFQHGDSSSDYKKAQQLALKAASLKADFVEAHWLSCAAEDRYLISTGRPQIWGTQYTGGFELKLEPIDRQAKTDNERKSCGLPPLKEIEMALKLEAEKQNAPQADN